MAKQKIKVTKKRTKKTGSGTKYAKCPTCSGSGRVRKR